MLTVAIVGKPNVGKSTLFNRIIKKKKSIIDDQPGVTRDRIYDYFEWLTKKIEIIDTGGIQNSQLNFQTNINNQVDFAIQEANVILFMVSGLNGVNHDDYFVAKKLKKIPKNKKVILVVNKSEKESVRNNINQYYSLGFGEPYFISSSHGIGVGDLLDEIIKYDTLNGDLKNDFGYRFCVIGKPNVGKSSLVNAILNEERVIVSEIAGSTRDSIDANFVYNGNNFTITDTAGIRRKGKITENIEKYAVLRAEMAIKYSNCILFMLDASNEFSELDEVIGGLAYSANIPTIIVVNKWDSLQKNNYTMNEYIKKIKNRFKYLSWAPIVFISAKNKSRLNTIFDTLNEIKSQINIKINNSLLNEIILNSQMLQEAPIFKGGRLKISYATQVQSQIQTFVIFCNNPKFLHFSYARYIENKIRIAFGLDKIPVTLYWKAKNED